MADNSMFNRFAVGSRNSGLDRKRIWNRNRMVVVWGETEGFQGSKLDSDSFHVPYQRQALTRSGP